MRISFSTGTYYHRPLRFSLRLARELGFDGVEWVVSPGYLLNGLDPIRAAFRESGVRALSVHPPFRRLPGWPRRSARAAARLGALARHLGAELFVVHTALYGSPHSPRAQRYAAALDLGRLAGGPRVRVGVETGQHNRRRPYLLDDLPELVRFCRERECGVTFDTCHAGANRQDLLECYAVLKPVLRNVHLSDMRWRGNRPYTHLPPGEGELPLAELLGRLARDGYDGLITLEIGPRRAGPLGHAWAARRLGTALGFVRAHVAPPAAHSASQACAAED